MAGIIEEREEGGGRERDDEREKNQNFYDNLNDIIIER